MRFDAPLSLRIYNVTRELPDVHLKHGGTLALGNFPFGNTLSVRFVDGHAHHNVVVWFAFISNGEVASLPWRVESFVKDTPVDSFSGHTTNGWIGVSGGRAPIDELRISVAFNYPNGFILVDRVRYGD